MVVRGARRHDNLQGRLLGLENNFCDLTPDRSAIICSLTEQKSDAWLMEDFDPEFRTSRAGGES